MVVNEKYYVTDYVDGKSIIKGVRIGKIKND